MDSAHCTTALNSDVIIEYIEVFISFNAHCTTAPNSVVRIEHIKVFISFSAHCTMALNSVAIIEYIEVFISFSKESRNDGILSEQNRSYLVIKFYSCKLF